jgi:hypothetical protein
LAIKALPAAGEKGVVSEGLHARRKRAGGELFWRLAEIIGDPRQLIRDGFVNLDG